MIIFDRNRNLEGNMEDTSWTWETDFRKEKI